MTNKRKSYDNRNRYYNSNNWKNNNTSNEDHASSDLPGFYYDPVKKKYFKIESTNTGISSLITNESIKNKQNIDELDKKIKLLSKKDTLFSTIEAMPYGVNHKMKNTYNNIIIIKSKLKKFYTFEDDSFNINDIYLFNGRFKSNSLAFDDDNLFLFINGYFKNTWPEIYKYKIFKLIKNEGEKKEFLFDRTRLIELPIENQELTRGNEQSLELPSYIRQNYLVTSSLMQNFRFYKESSWKLSISTLSLNNNLRFNLEHLASFKYKLPIWCSNLNLDYSNSNLTKCAAGLSKYCQVNNVNNSMQHKLDTQSSDVFCVRFMPSNAENMVYCGCKNKNIFGHDLRVNQRSSNGLQSSISRLEHESRLISMEFQSSNYLFSYDLTGKAYMWDLRANRIVSTYFDDSECDTKFSSMKLSDNGAYLYSIPKDGCVRIWDVKSNQLIKIIESPFRKEIYNAYAEIPKIHLLDQSEFLYSIKNDLMHFSL